MIRDEGYPPGHLVLEEINERGWTPNALAQRSGLRPAYVWSLLIGKAIVTRRAAAGLASAFGTSEALFINLERRWRDWMRNRLWSDADMERWPREAAWSLNFWLCKELGCLIPRMNPDFLPPEPPTPGDTHAASR